MGLKAREDARRIAALWQQLSKQSTAAAASVPATGGRVSPLAGTRLNRQFQEAKELEHTGRVGADQCIYRVGCAKKFLHV